MSILHNEDEEEQIITPHRRLWSQQCFARTSAEQCEPSGTRGKWSTMPRRGECDHGGQGDQKDNFLCRAEEWFAPRSSATRLSARTTGDSPTK